MLAKIIVLATLALSSFLFASSEVSANTLEQTIFTNVQNQGEAIMAVNGMRILNFPFNGTFAFNTGATLYAEHEIVNGVFTIRPTFTSIRDIIYSNQSQNGGWTFDNSIQPGNFSSLISLANTGAFPNGYACIMKSDTINEYTLVATIDTFFSATLARFDCTNVVLAGYTLYNSEVTDPNANNFTPDQEVVAGLVCETYMLPDIDQANWYNNYGSLQNRDVFRENGSLVQTGTGANSLDVFAVIGASSGATLPVGSISFNGTTYADIADLSPSGETPALYAWLKRDGAIAGWNVVQIRGVNTSGFFGKYGIFEGKSTDGFTNQKIMYASGSIAEANLFNNKTGTTFQIFSPVSGFSGVRIGYAPYVSRKSCYKPGINSCEWKIQGGQNICGPVISQNFEIGICGVTGSGSIYGSGSCAPLVDISGEVIDAGILPGQGQLITLPDGSTKLVRIQPEQVSILFACPKSRDEPWYKYLFSCGGEVIGNIFDKVTGNTKTLFNNQVGTYSNDRLYTGTFTGIIQNFGAGTSPLVGSGANLTTSPLLLAIKAKLDTVGQPGPNLWQKMFTGALSVGILIMILSILGMIIGSIRDRGEISNNKKQ